MPLANVALTDTFDTWRVRTNQIITNLDQANTVITTVSGNTAASFDKANSANLLAFNISIGANARTNTVGLASNTWASAVGVSVSAASNSWSNVVGSSANSRTDLVGAASNTFAQGVGVSANAYTISVATSTNVAAFNYANVVGVRANTWANTIGASANGYTVIISGYSNNYSNVVSASSNAWANVVGSSANAYALVTSTSTVATAHAWANVVGTRANSFATESVTPAFNRANTAFQNTAGTLQGSLTVVGTITATSDITAYSDARLKENVENIDNSLSLIKQLRGVTFDWIESGKHSYGLIAQEVEKVIPEIVIAVDGGVKDLSEEEKIKTIDYSKVVPILVECIKNLSDRVEELERKV